MESGAERQNIGGSAEQIVFRMSSGVEPFCICEIRRRHDGVGKDVNGIGGGVFRLVIDFQHTVTGGWQSQFR